MAEFPSTESLEGLGNRASLAFVLSVVERMVPNYEVFASRNNFTPSDDLNRALRRGWDRLAGVPVAQEDLSQLLELLERALPDTEDYQDVLVSSALSAAGAACALVDLLMGRDRAEVVSEVSTLAMDTVDIYSSPMVDSPTLVLGEDEAALAARPLVRREASRQSDAVDYLAQVDWDDPPSVEQIRWRLVRDSSGSLGLMAPRFPR